MRSSQYAFRSKMIAATLSKYCAIYYGQLRFLKAVPRDQDKEMPSWYGEGVASSNAALQWAKGSDI